MSSAASTCARIDQNNSSFGIRAEKVRVRSEAGETERSVRSRQGSRTDPRLDFGFRLRELESEKRGGPVLFDEGKGSGFQRRRHLRHGRVRLEHASSSFHAGVIRSCRPLRDDLYRYCLVICAQIR